jgi:hypothetical protein
MSKPYSDAKRVEAVTSYLALGKLPLVSAVVDIPVSTLRQWKLQPWWKELIDEIHREDEFELDAKLSKIIDRTLDAVVERVEHGEFILDSKTGQVKRVPVKLRDVHRVSVDLIDKRNLIRGKPTSRVEKTETVDTLQKLAAQFAEWVKIGIKREEKTIEGEVLAVHEERSEGLQDRVQQVPQQEKTNQEPSQA